MSQIEKLFEKFDKKPIPNNITFREVEKLANSLGCQVLKSGCKHPFKIFHRESGTIITIPVHGKYVQEAYIKQLKILFEHIREEKLK